MKKSIQAFFTFSAIAVGSILSSCHIYEDEGDCSVHYRVPFTYTMNVLNADAFSSQVSSVTLYVFDSAGRLALTKTESGEALAAPGYAMDVELLPGRYTMLAWCEGTPSFTPSTAFTIGGGGSPTAITELSASLPLRNSGTSAALYSDLDIKPLFYGYKADIDCPDTYGTVTLPAIDLTKDTNVFNIALENIEGTEIAPDALTVTIEATNSELDWRNAVVSTTPFTYRPWAVTLLSSERPDTSRADGEGGEGGEGSGTGPAVNPVTGILAELTTGRLMADRKPMLVVHRNTDDKEIIRLDLIQLLCMVRGHFGNWSAQEYLDRLDRYSLTFFVDADLNWYSASGINILGWKVVPPQDVDF